MSDIDHITAARALIEPLTGYTPGIWEPFFGEAYRVRSDGMTIATAHFVTQLNRIPTKQVAANTALIAAAPALRDMVATLADAQEAAAAEAVSLQDLNAALAREAGKLWAENQRLRKIIEKMDEHSPRADHTCAEPGITLSEAVMREWPELAEPKGEVSE